MRRWLDRRRVTLPGRWLRPLLLFCFAGCLNVYGLAAASAASPDLRDVEIGGNAERTRLVLNFDGEPEPKWFLLRAPHRLVIDLPQTRFLFDARKLKPKGLLLSMRYGQLGAGSSRIILGGKGPFTIESFDVLPNDGGGFRIAFDMVAASDKAFEAALAVQAQTTGSTRSTPKGDRLVHEGDATADRFTIVIDPGHGGIDGGAEGLNGTVEKAITLAFAQQLQEALLATGRYDVYLTRSTDEFLRLDERVRIARQHGADLFLSIHADTINVKGISGATIYTVSEKASDAEAEATALRENLSDELAGITVEAESQQVADILIDLIRRETHGFSMRFARSLVGELSDTVGLINNPHRSAGFKVLKAPDVPSVLLELGYLSNVQDEAHLRDPDWRKRAADSIVKAVALFEQARTASGG
ncbi:MAG: N-acetylmuramoyl-L-alanine amidase [Rhizobiaceae bacterium]|nr:N-acetylmuramoyl-L-alanine amidase [Rhizobiaceae bacterium]